MYLIPTIYCSIRTVTVQRSITKEEDSDGYLPIKLIAQGTKRELFFGIYWLHWRYTCIKTLSESPNDV